MIVTLDHVTAVWNILLYNNLGQRKETWKMSVKSELGSFRPMNSFNLILALLSSAFFITLCLQVGVFDNFDACLMQKSL